MQKIIILLSIMSSLFCHTAQAMEQDVEFYNEKHEMSFLMQAIEKVKRDQSEESEEELKIVEQKNSNIKSVKNYSCSRENCIFVASHQNRIDKHREMHRLQDTFLSTPIYRCETCHYLTDTQRNINDHKKTHSNLKEYHCKACDVWFKSVRGKNRHERESRIHKENSKKDRPCLVLTNG